MRKKVLSIILCLCMMFMILPISASAETVTGDGYSFDTDTGVLTVTSNNGSLSWRSDGILSDDINTVVIADGVTAIGMSAFVGCVNLTSVSIPDSVTNIAEYAFAGDTALTSIALPSGLTKIERALFSGCSSLTSISIPSGVTVIGEYAFERAGITSVTIPEGVTINPYAFTGSNLTTVKIPSSAYLFHGIFSECKSLKEAVLEEGCGSIGAEAFMNCTSLEKVVLPSTVGYIPPEAFRGCTKLSSISLLHINNIDKSAFRGCKSLASVTIPESTNSIGEYAFNGCTNLGNVTFMGTNNLEIDTAAFQNLLPGCTFTKDSSKTFSGAGAGDINGSGLGGLGYDFDSSTGAMSVYSNAGVENWRDDGINKDEIKSLSFESGVTEITDYAFIFSSNLASVKILGTVKKIGYNAFDSCTQLGKIELADGIDYVAGRAFDSTKYYNDAKNWRNNVLYIGSYAIQVKDTATSITVKSGTKAIASDFAASQASLKSVNLPDSLKKIGKEAFFGTGIETVTIPSSVTDIGESAFYNCAKLKEVVFEGSGALAIGWDAFTGVASDCKFYKTSDSKGITGDGKPTTIELKVPTEKDYSIALTTPTNGTASLSKTSAVAGTKITVTTKAADGYSTDKVTVTYSDGKEAYATRVNDTTYTFTLAAKNATVKVEFKKMGVVTITKPEHGSATATPTSAFEKTKITVKPVADSGYAVEKVTATDKSGKDVAITQNSDGTYSFIMPDGDVTVNVTFKESYTVTIEKATNGKAEAVSNAAPKTKVILTVTPDNGYIVDSITIKDKDNKVIETKEEGYRKYSFTMPSSNVTVTPKFKVTDWDNKFTDVKTSDWYYPYVEYVQKNKLMVGTSNTTFAPNTTTNRGMIVTILYRLEKEPSVAGITNFPDVPSDKWYANAVAWAKDKEITYGDEFGHFGAGNDLTREQLAAMFYRYAEYKDKVTRATEKLEFTDSSKVSDWAEEAIKWCVENDIISGKGNNILDPQGKATRAEMATMISRFIEEID